MRVHPASLLLVLATPQVAQDRARLGAPYDAEILRDELIARTIVDLDEDGDPDVLAFDGGLVLMENDGGGRLDRVELVALTGVSAPSFAVAEFDGVPGLDVVLRDATSLRLFTRQSSGSYVEAVGALPYPVSYGLMSAGDVDGDGDQDLALAGRVVLDQLLLNDGTGFFSPAPAANLAATTSARVALADFDGNGTVDLLGRTLFLNDGTGVFVVSASARTPGTWHQVLDIDGDGDVDILVEEFDGDFHTVRLNDGSGVFGPALKVSTGLYPSFVDLDGDGDLDIVSGAPFSTFLGFQHFGIDVWRNEGAYPFVADHDPDLVFWLPTIESVLAADWDGDGDPDAFCMPERGSKSRSVVLWNEAGVMELGKLGLETEYDESFRYPDVQLADIDGDGDLDGVLSVFVGRNTGAGRLELERYLPRPPSAYRMFDLEGDGDLDSLTYGAYLGSASTNGAELLVNTGTRFVRAPSGLPPLGFTPPTAGAILAGDLDGMRGDDVVLLVAGSTGPANTRVLLADGAGKLVESPASAALPSLGRAGDLGDVDGDGDLDAVCVFDSGGSWTIETLLNPGDGALVASGLSFPVPAGRNQVRLADMDGDGNLDLVTAQRDLAEVHRGTGTGAFELPAVVTLPFSASLPAEGTFLGLPAEPGALPDVYSSQGFLYRNHGSFQFVDDSASLAPRFEASAGVAFGDIDGDGDVDAQYAGFGETHWGLRRHIAARHRPAIGRTLTLDVWGDAGGLYLAWASASLSRRNMGPGTFQLARIGLVRVAVGTLDPTGRATIEVAVPNDASLVGLEVFWQASVGTPPRLTNATSTLLHAL